MTVSHYWRETPKNVIKKLKWLKNALQYIHGIKHRIFIKHISRILVKMTFYWMWGENEK